jgi:hypothetical protein
MFFLSSTPPRLPDSPFLILFMFQSPSEVALMSISSPEIMDAMPIGVRVGTEAIKGKEGFFTISYHLS